MTVLPCSQATRLLKDSVVIDPNTRGEAVCVCVCVCLYTSIYRYL